MDTARESSSSFGRYGKWAGLYGGVIGVFAHQQINSSWIYAYCPANTLALVLAIGASCAVLCLITGAWSWHVRRALRHDEAAHVSTNTDRFIASLSAAMAVIGLMFIVFASLAAWFLQCQR